MVYVPSNKFWLFPVVLVTRHWPVVTSSRISNGTSWAVLQLSNYLRFKHVHEFQSGVRSVSRLNFAIDPCST